MRNSMRAQGVILAAVLVGAATGLADEGAALFKQGKFEAAALAFRSSIEKDSKSVSAHAGLVRSRLRLDDWRPALEDARRAVKEIPSDASLHALLGTALRRSGKLAEARDEWLRAAALDPRDYDARIGLASLESLDGHFASARDLALRAARDVPDRPEAWHRLIDVLTEEGRLSEAVEAAERLLALNPGGKIYEHVLETLPGMIAIDKRLGMATPYSLLATAGRIDLPASFDRGYVFVDLSLNGKEPTPFILDTGGSTVVSIDDDLAQKIGLENLSPITVRGASGRTSAYATAVASIEAGQWKVANIPGIVFDLDPLGRLLGRTFGVLGTGWITRQSVTIDFAAKVLSIETPALESGLQRPERATLDEDAGGERLRIPFWLVGDGKIVFEVECDEETRLALLDTGSPASFFSTSYVREHTPEDQLKKLPSLSRGVGSGEAVDETLLGRAVSLRIGGRKLPVPPLGTSALDTAVSRGAGIQIDALLGNGFLALAKRARIDYANRLLTLEGLKPPSEK